MSIFSKFFELVKKWFRPSKALPASTIINDEETIDSTINNVNSDINSITNSTSEATTPSLNQERDIFATELKIQKQEEKPELLELQSRFESNQIPLSELTDDELDSLNSLYQRQIDELKDKIYKTKTEINVNMKKLEDTVTSA